MTMMRTVLRAAAPAAAVLTVLVGATLAVRGQSGAKNGEWPTYGGDLGNTPYSPLDQISRDNFKNLQVAWRIDGIVQC
jgi:glucose dehydrogenase